MQHRTIENGLLKVYVNGDIYFKNDNKWTLLKQYEASYNRKYRSVYYKEEGMKRRGYVHRFVAKAFIPNPENKPQVNHIDGNPSNNNVGNLEWVTSSENIKHAFAIGLCTKRTCAICGKEGFGNTELCRECSARIKSRIPAAIRNYKRVGEYIDALGKIDIEELSSLQAKIALHLISGKGYAEIGAIKGMSKQNINYHALKIFKPKARKVKCTAQS